MSESASEGIKDRFNHRFKTLTTRVKELSELRGDELFKKWGIRGSLKVSMNVDDIIGLQRDLQDLNDECEALEAQLGKIEAQHAEDLRDWIKAKKEELVFNKGDISSIIKKVERRLQGKRAVSEETKEKLESKNLDEASRVKVLRTECEEEYDNLAKYTNAILKNMTGDEFLDFKDKVAYLSTQADRLLSGYGKTIPDELIRLAVKIDNLSSHVVEMEKERSVASRAYYGITGTPIPKLGGKYWLLTKGEQLKNLKAKKMDDIQKEWEKKITDEFEASDKATPMTKAGIEGRRWGTTYLITREQAEAIRRKKTAYDEVRATKEACHELGLAEQEAYETVKHIVKATAVTAQEMVEQSVVTTGQAVMVGLGGPAYAALIIAWDATFAALEKGGNLLSRGFATVDAFAEESIMKIFGKVAKNPDGSIDWSSGDKIAKNIGLGALHALRTVSWLPKILTSGVAAGTRAISQAIGDFTKKNIIPILGIGGTAVAAYFIAITIASVFTLGIPLAITLVGLAAAAVGAGIATYMRTKSKAQEAINLKLSPEEETMLMRYDYQQKVAQQKELGSEPEIAATGLQKTKALSPELKVRKEAVNVAVVELHTEKESTNLEHPGSEPLILSGDLERKSGGEQRQLAATLDSEKEKPKEKPDPYN